jgi:hypothetical protein
MIETITFMGAEVKYQKKKTESTPDGPKNLSPLSG